MIEKIFLPRNLMTFHKPFFSYSNQASKGNTIRKAQQKVKMIRHQYNQMTKPSPFIMIMPDRTNNLSTDHWSTELIDLLRLSTKRKEIDGCLGNPIRRSMTQMLPQRELHPCRLTITLNSTEEKPDDNRREKPHHNQP